MKVLQNETIKYIYSLRDTKIAQWETSLKLDSIYNVLIREGYNEEHITFILKGKKLNLM